LVLVELLEMILLLLLAATAQIPCLLQSQVAVAVVAADTFSARQHNPMVKMVVQAVVAMVFLPQVAQALLTKAMLVVLQAMVDMLLQAVVVQVRLAQTQLVQILPQ
jgi:hypothetical protein